MPTSSPPIERRALLILRTMPAEDIERTANSDIHTTGAEFLGAGEVVHAASAASIGHRLVAPDTEALHKRFVDTFALPFHIHGMDEEFITVG